VRTARRAAPSSATPPGSLACLDSCRLRGSYLAALLTGTPKDRLRQRDAAKLGITAPKVLAIATGSYLTKGPLAIRRRVIEAPRRGRLP
jgi:hypothetical protein